MSPIESQLGKQIFAQLDRQLSGRLYEQLLPGRIL